jgi:type IV secretory pathway VirB4 component
MISTFETIRLFGKNRYPQCLADIIFMIDFLFPGKPFILNKDGTLFVVFEIEGIEYEGMDPETIDDIEKDIRVFSETIKEDVTITNYFIRRKGGKLSLNCAKQAPPVVRFLQGKKEKFYNSLGDETFQSTILCCLKLNRPLIKQTNLSYFTRPEREFVFLKDQLLESYKRLLSLYNLAKTNLKNIGIRELSCPEIFRHFFFLINGEKEAPPYREDLSLNSQLARSSYTFKKDLYRVDERFRRIISVIDEPPATERMFFNSFFDFSGTIVLKNTFFTMDYDRHKRDLLSNYKISKAMLFKKTLSAEYVSEYDEHELKVEKERQRPFFHNLSIMVEEESEAALNKKTDLIIAQVCKTGAYADKEKGYLPPSAVAFFPGQANFNRRKHYILSSNLANLFVKGKLSKGDSEPVEYFLDRSGYFYGLNPFSSGDAPHMIISGSTGKGKSYLLIKILLSFLSIDSRIIAIDRSLETFFEVLAEIDPENTTIMRIDNENVDLKFNPFQVDENGTGKVTEAQLSLCEGLLEIIIGEAVNQGNRYLIRGSLEQFFEEYGEAVKHSSDVIKPLDLLVTIIRDKFRDEKVEQAVRLWQEGDRGEILNSGVDNLSNRKYCLFDLKGIEDRPDILRVVVYLLFYKIDRMVADESLLAVPKILAIDEAKYYYDNRELAPLLDKYLRQGRKYHLCVIMNFQSINDALELDPEGNLVGWSKGLFENTQKFILFGRQLKIDNALDALKLTGYQKMLYDGLDTAKREFMLVPRGGSSRVLTPVTGPWTNVIATSHPREREYRNRLRLECGDYIETIKRFVEITEGSRDLEQRLKKLDEYFNRGKP